MSLVAKYVANSENNYSRSISAKENVPNNLCEYCMQRPVKNVIEIDVIVSWISRASLL